jgi:hypothetical protein
MFSKQSLVNVSYLVKVIILLVKAAKGLVMLISELAKAKAFNKAARDLLPLMN